MEPLHAVSLSPFALAFFGAALLVTLAVLAAWDCECRRLPNQWTALLFLQAVGWSLAAGREAAILGGAVWAGVYLAAGLRGGIGGGDVKLAAGLGTLVGVFSVPLVLLASAGASLLALCEFGIRRVCVGASGRGGTLAHGPHMIAAAVASCAGFVLL